MSGLTLDMKESYLFHSQISDLWNPTEVWVACLLVIEQFNASMAKNYHVCCGEPDFSANVLPHEIEKLLSLHDSDSYLITWRNKELETMHSFSYFSREKSLSFRFAKELVTRQLDNFGSALADSLPLSNMVVQQQSYLMPLRKHRNPGRNNLYIAPCYNNGRDGYIEGVSAEIWLGEPFWEHAKCSKADVLKQDWLHCEERPSHLYVRAWPEPFSSAEGEQGEIQRRMLDLLFGINAKTPPPLP